MQNNDKYQFVSVSGCYWSGSSAVLDILREQPSCSIIEDEFCGFSYGEFFKLISDAKGKNLIDKRLLHALNKLKKFGEAEPPLAFSGARAILSLLRIYPAFLFYFRMGMNKKIGLTYERLVSEICDGVVSGKFFTDGEGSYNLSLLLNALLWEVADRSLQSVSDEEILDQTGPERLAVFDQLVAAPYSTFALEYLPSLKIINVDRDWRDQYVEMRPLISRLINVNRTLGSRPWGENWEELDSNIDFFVDLRKRVTEHKNMSSSASSILWVQFEDLVISPDEQIARILIFLDREISRLRFGKIFKAEESRKNVGKWRYSGLDRELDEIAERLS